MAEIVKPAVDLIYPPRCPICGDAIGAQNGVCVACWSELELPTQTGCASCGRPIDGYDAVGSPHCARCLANPPQHDGIISATVYNDASRKLVLAFKHGRRIALAKMFGRLMAGRLTELGDDWIFVPVPLHRFRLWYRGFNQAALLAQEIARIRKQQVVVDGLFRRKATRTLGGLGRKTRERTLKGAITINPRRRETIRSANIILVDDVLTSGATSNACVQALKSAGANKVIISCFARVGQDSM